jgi:hypothetical protein
MDLFRKFIQKEITQPTPAASTPTPTPAPAPAQPAADKHEKAARSRAYSEETPSYKLYTLNEKTKQRNELEREKEEASSEQVLNSMDKIYFTADDSEIIFIHQFRTLSRSAIQREDLTTYDKICELFSEITCIYNKRELFFLFCCFPVAFSSVSLI